MEHPASGSPAGFPAASTTPDANNLAHQTPSVLTIGQKSLKFCFAKFSKLFCVFMLQNDAGTAARLLLFLIKDITAFLLFGWKRTTTFR